MYDIKLPSLFASCNLLLQLEACSISGNILLPSFSEYDCDVCSPFPLQLHPLLGFPGFAFSSPHVGVRVHRGNAGKSHAEILRWLADESLASQVGVVRGRGLSTDVLVQGSVHGANVTDVGRTDQSPRLECRHLAQQVRNRFVGVMIQVVNSTLRQRQFVV